MITNFLDLETSGLETALQRNAPRTSIGISEFALWGQQGLTGGYTDILSGSLSEKLSAHEFHKRLTSGPIKWDPGFAIEGDVLAGVFERHVAATRSGRAIYKESQAVQAAMDVLSRGEALSAWNARFDIGQLTRTAKKLGINEWSGALTKAKSEGRIIEASKPVQEFLFNWARQGKIQLSQASKEAKRKIAFGQWGSKEIEAAPIEQLVEPMPGFQRLFQERPNISWKQYSDEILEGDTALAFQSYGSSKQNPIITYARGWKQHTIAEAISPGFLKAPEQTPLGKEIYRRMREGGVEIHDAKSHAASFDVFLSQILNEKFSAPDPIKALADFGVKSEGQLQTQYKSAYHADAVRYMKTYGSDMAPREADYNYLNRVIATAENRAAAPELARIAAEKSQRMPSLKSIYMEAWQDMQHKAAKYPRATKIGAIVGGILLADALVPEDNRLEGRRNPHSKYTRIRGITFEGIASPAGTDFGSGRLIDNETSAISYRMSQSNVTKTHQGYSIGEIEEAQTNWAGIIGQASTRLLDSSEYTISKAGRLAMPGVKQNAWVGVVDLKNYRTKVDDGDTLTLYRRGVTHLFDKPVSVRMAGIDAPETHPNWPFAMQPAGVESGKYLRTLIENQTSMHLIIDPSRTTYGRQIGILSGNVTPNINLKMVSAGAAAALPYDGTGEIAAYREYEKAEAFAATSGLGMWSSKGWQAKRMMDLSLGARVTNTSLQNMHRLSTRAGLAQYHSFVQDLHNSAPSDPWDSDSVMAMQYLLSGMSKTDLTSEANRKLKEYGWDRGIRDGSSPANTLPFGINPSGINVSAFGSGWTIRKADKVAKMADVLGHFRRKIDLLKEPLLAPSAPKRKYTSMLVRYGDKRTVNQSMKPWVDTTIYSMPAWKKSGSADILPPTYVSGIKGHIQDALNASGAASSVHMARSHKSGWRRSKFIGAYYSAHSAIRNKPLNEYQAVKGWGFSSSWQEDAWKNFHSSKVLGTHLPKGYEELTDALKKAGFNNPDDILFRFGVAEKYNKQVSNKVETAYDAIKAIGKSIYSGQPAFYDNAKLYFDARARRAKEYMGIARRTKFKSAISQNLAVQQIQLKHFLSNEKGVLGKIGGLLQFAAADPMHTFAPESWTITKSGLKEVAKEPGWTTKAWNRVKQQLRAEGSSETIKGIRGRVGGLADKVSGGRSLLKGMGAVMKNRVGVFGVGISVAMGYATASEYENQYAGFGLEVGAGIASTAAGFTAGALIAPHTKAAGFAIGGALGTVIAPGVGTAIGAGIGAIASFAVDAAVGMLTYYGITTMGQTILKKRNSSPYMEEPNQGPWIPSMNAYGGKDAYLTAGHGIQGRPEFSGFGGGLKPLREAVALADTLGRSSSTIVGSMVQKTPTTYARTRSRLQPTAGLVNNVLWNNRHRKAPRGPMTWTKHNQSSFRNESRMSMAV